MKVVVVVVALLAFHHERAEACSCIVEPTILPADGAVDVPLNTRLVVHLKGGSPLFVTLHDVTNDEDVAIHVADRFGLGWGAALIATPAMPLRANTSYAITASNYDFPPSYSAGFTTGNRIDTTPPAFDGLQSITPETMVYPPPDMVCASSCVVGDGHVSRLRLAYPTVPDDVAVFVLELLNPEDRGVMAEVGLATWRDDVLGFSSCAPRAPVLDPGAEYCARLIAYDLAGNASGASQEVCATTATCEPRVNDYCEPDSACHAPSPEPEPTTTGCSTTRPSIGYVFLVLLGLMLRRRRRA